VGLHRLLIHRSFTAPEWLERLLAWLGVLVGMAGPFGMIRAHDMRDWHQRQVVCPPHPSHGAGWLRDAWWQMHCRFDLPHPPRFEIEPEIADDPFYRWLEATWRWQQLIPAIALFAIGGVGFVLWGICLRVAVSLIGHWAVGHAAHKGGHQGWEIAGLPVQGFNLRGLGLLTFGECFHSNHHAFPHSAQLGVERGQVDPGFWLIRSLEAVGLTWDVKGPAAEPERDGLTRVPLEDLPEMTERDVLRGVWRAYLVSMMVAFVPSLIALIIEPASVIGFYILTSIVGLILLVPAGVAAMVTFMVLRLFGQRVSWWMPIVVVFVILGAIFVNLAAGDFGALVWAVILAPFLGLSFWFGAVGRSRIANLAPCRGPGTISTA